MDPWQAPIAVLAMRRFAGIDLSSGRIPDETTILIFRHLLEKQGLREQIHCFADDVVDEMAKTHLNNRRICGMATRRWSPRMLVARGFISAPR